MNSDNLDVLHKALRSMTVTLIANRAPSHRAEEWSYVLKNLAAITRRPFPVASDRFISLRCMLLEACELADMIGSEQAERPGVVEVIGLLEKEARPMHVSEIADCLGLDLHSVSSRVRIGISIGAISPDYEQWDRMTVSSVSVGERER
ncbi:hypothetical protein G6L37_02780 [Agrobacterium rubi]|nr:hypothetical protein [Agrobacterium rubi]NTF24306.1 hypothetical protein [Agrobacterium rubi]